MTWSMMWKDLNTVSASKRNTTNLFQQLEHNHNIAALQPSAFTGQTLPANCRGKTKYIKETPSLMLIEVKCSIVLIWGPARAYLSTRAVWGLNEGATQQPHCSAKYERAVPDENGNNKHVSPLEAQILRRRRRQELVSRVGIQCGAFLCGVYTAQRHASVVNWWF